MSLGICFIYIFFDFSLALGGLCNLFSGGRTLHSQLSNPSHLGLYTLFEAAKA